MFPEIREIRVSTLQKQESFAVKTADLSYCRNNIEIKLAVPAKGAVTALQLSACLTEREDGLGYPDAFVPEASLRLSVEADAFDGFLAVYQHKAWWARPACGTRPEEIPEKTQLLITQTDGNYTEEWTCRMNQEANPYILNPKSLHIISCSWIVIHTGKTATHVHLRSKSDPAISPLEISGISI